MRHHSSLGGKRLSPASIRPWRGGARACSPSWCAMPSAPPTTSGFRRSESLSSEPKLSCEKSRKAPDRASGRARHNSGVPLELSWLVRTEGQAAAVSLTKSPIALSHLPVRRRQVAALNLEPRAVLTAGRHGDRQICPPPPTNWQ